MRHGRPRFDYTARIVHLQEESVMKFHPLVLMGRAAILMSAVLGATATVRAEDPAAAAGAAKVLPGTIIVPLMNQALTGIDGKEGTMLTVEYAPGDRKSVV